MDKNHWNDELKRLEVELGFNEGYRLVYGPWETLDHAKIAFVSLNPGAAPQDEPRRLISEDEGNTYERAEHNTKSPLTGQFLKLAALLETCPEDILTGVVAPFRSSDWRSLSKGQRLGSLCFGRRFWSEALARPSLKLIIVCSGEARRLVIDITGAKPAGSIRSGWGNTMLRRYRAGHKRIVALPHLSRVRLLSCDPYESILRGFLETA